MNAHHSIMYNQVFIIYFCPKGLPFYHFLSEVLLGIHFFSAFVYLKKSLFHIYLFSSTHNSRLAVLTLQMCCVVFWHAYVWWHVACRSSVCCSLLHCSCFSSFLFVTGFEYFIMVWLGIVFFIFLVFGVHIASCIQVFIVFTKFGKISTLISLNIFLPTCLSLGRKSITHT